MERNSHVPTIPTYSISVEPHTPHYERAKKEAAAHKDGPVKRGVGLGAHSFGVGSPSDGAPSGH